MDHFRARQRAHHLHSHWRSLRARVYTSWKLRHAGGTQKHICSQQQCFEQRRLVHTRTEHKQHQTHHRRWTRIHHFSRTKIRRHILSTTHARAIRPPANFHIRRQLHLRITSLNDFACLFCAGTEGMCSTWDIEYTGDPSLLDTELQFFFFRKGRPTRLQRRCKKSRPQCKTFKSKQEALKRTNGEGLCRCWPKPTNFGLAPVFSESSLRWPHASNGRLAHLHIVDIIRFYIVFSRRCTKGSPSLACIRKSCCATSSHRPPRLVSSQN